MSTKDITSFASLDFETLALDKDAAVHQAGVAFGAINHSTKEVEILDMYYAEFYITEQKGRDITASTTEWARETYGNNYVERALSANFNAPYTHLQYFINIVGSKIYNSDLVITRGHFDIPILESLKKRSLPFRKFVDARTLSLIPRGGKFCKKAEHPHLALSDAINNVEVLAFAYEYNLGISCQFPNRYLQSISDLQQIRSLQELPIGGLQSQP